MARQDKMITKRIGRPPTGKGTLIGVRLSPIIIEALEAQTEIFQKALPDRVITRPLIIRSLIAAELQDHNWITEDEQPGPALLKHRQRRADQK